ncbi:MAG: type IV toxin-antitoxin system AbiEi family antitoxin domain-containing protein [Nocardioidaceae bacterium]
MTPRGPQPSTALLDDRFALSLRHPFTLDAAAGVGISRYRLRTLERDGYVRRLIKGVYVAAQVPDSRLLRSRALTLLVPEHGVVTDWTACWFWTGVLRPGDHLRDPTPTFFRTRGHGRLRNELCASGERTLSADDVVAVDGLSVTTPLRTAWDIGRLTHRDTAIGGLDSLLRLGTFSRDDLLAGVERFRGMRGVVQLRALAPLADARAESPGESLLRLRWLDLTTLPRPEPQVRIVHEGVEVYRIDLAVPELAYGCEYDGADFHTSARDADRDRRRRADLADRFGWDVEAVTRADVFGPSRDVERRLHEGITRARRSLARRTASASATRAGSAP